MVWINAIVQGILLGGLYALFATGLSLAFGVMRFVNLAHGDLAIAAAFMSFSLQRTFDMNPLVSLLIVLPGAFLVGYLLQRVVFDRVVGVDPAFQIRHQRHDQHRLDPTHHTARRGGGALGPRPVHEAHPDGSRLPCDLRRP